MKIAVCDRCKAKNVEGVICRHCDSAFCYDCLDTNPRDMKICQECGKFICEECYDGMIKCDFKKNKV